MEEVTLEKIDLLRDRTGVSYREARDVLARTAGDVIEALVELEGKKQNKWTEEFSVRSGEVIDKVKEIVREGNVTKIRVKHDDKILVEIPVTLGAIGAVVLPQLAALGVLVAVFKRCTLEVVRGDDGISEEFDTKPPDADKESQRNIL
jgi:hypothetical protein